MSYSDLMAGLLLMIILLLVLLIANYRTEVIAREQQLESKEELLQEKEELLRETEDKYREVQTYLEERVGIRRHIIEDLIAAFSESDLELEIDPDTGAIRIPGAVLFAFNEHSLTQAGMDYLEEFVPAYAAVLLNPAHKEHLEQIIVEGHTDSSGGYLYNLRLSQRRALAAVEYILGGDSHAPDHPPALTEFITANGRSFSSPILKEDGSVDAPRSRRVEFKFRLKDDVFLEEMTEVLLKAVEP